MNVNDVGQSVVVHAWVMQKLLNCNVLRVYSSVPLGRELRDARPLSEATADLS